MVTTSPLQPERSGRRAPGPEASTKRSAASMTAGYCRTVHFSVRQHPIGSLRKISDGFRRRHPGRGPDVGRRDHDINVHTKQHQKPASVMAEPSWSKEWQRRSYSWDIDPSQQRTRQTPGHAAWSADRRHTRRLASGNGSGVVERRRRGAARRMRQSRRSQRSQGGARRKGSETTPVLARLTSTSGHHATTL